MRNSELGRPGAARPLWSEADALRGRVADAPALYGFFSFDAALAQRALDGVLHFSRRSAEAYLDCTARARMRVRALVPVHFCLSVQVSHPLLAVGAPRIRIAPRPDEAALLELVGEG